MKPPASPDPPPHERATVPPGSNARGWMTQGELVSGKYRLEHKLGKGAMGSVWACTHLALDTPVAVKFLTWDAAPEGQSDDRAQGSQNSSGDRRADARARFEREAKAAAQIRSANVVQVFDYGVDRGVPFIVMELLDGEDLNKRLQRVGRLTPAATARLVQAIARALQRAHDVGLVHRDLKPGNIFLARDGDHEVPKIVDFGVVKAMGGGEQKLATDGSENTMEGTLIGTPSYMSPEQALGRTDIDHRSDLWSVGVILFQVLTGMKPFPGGNLFEALVRICSDPIPRASAIAPDLPAGVDAFFDRALERDVGKRFQSARELERAFYALVARPATSLPPEPLEAAREHPLVEGGAPWVERETSAEGVVVPVRLRRASLFAAIAGGAVILGVGVAAVRRSGSTPAAGPPPIAASANPTAPSAAASEALEAPPTAAITAAPSPAAPPPAVSATLAPSSSTHAPTGGPRPGTPSLARPQAPAPQPAGRKPKRDLGY